MISITIPGLTALVFIFIANAIDTECKLC